MWFYSDRVDQIKPTLNLRSFTTTQGGFGVGFGDEEDDVDKAGVSLLHQHPACFGQIIQACAQTTGQGFVLSLEEARSCGAF